MTTYRSKELVHSSMAWVEPALFLLKSKFNYRMESLLQNTGIGFSWEDECDSTKFGTSPLVTLKKKKIGTTISGCLSKGTALDRHSKLKWCYPHDPNLVECILGPNLIHPAVLPLLIVLTTIMTSAIEIQNIRDFCHGLLNREHVHSSAPSIT